MAAAGAGLVTTTSSAAAKTNPDQSLESFQSTVRVSGWVGGLTSALHLDATLKVGDLAFRRELGQRDLLPDLVRPALGRPGLESHKRLLPLWLAIETPHQHD